MITRQFQELTLSALGFGAMRLPVLDGNDSRIDKKETFRMVDEAMSKGINYYDTASWEKPWQSIPGTVFILPQSSPGMTFPTCRK